MLMLMMFSFGVQENRKQRVRVSYKQEGCGDCDREQEEMWLKKTLLLKKTFWVIECLTFCFISHRVPKPVKYPNGTSISLAKLKN